MGKIHQEIYLTLKIALYTLVVVKHKNAFENLKLPSLSHHDVKVHVQVDRAGDAVIVVEELFPFHFFYWLKMFVGDRNRLLRIARGSDKHCIYQQQENRKVKNRYQRFSSLISFRFNLADSFSYLKIQSQNHLRQRLRVTTHFSQTLGPREKQTEFHLFARDSH